MVWSNIAPKVEKSYLYPETPKKSFFQKLIFFCYQSIFLPPRYLCLKLGTKWHKWWKYKNVSWIMKIIHSGVWGMGEGLCFDVNVIDVTEVNKDTQVYDIFIQLWPNWKEESHRREKTTQSTLPTYMSRRPFVYILCMATKLRMR